MVGMYNIIQRPGSVAISIKIKERTHRQDIRTNNLSDNNYRKQHDSQKIFLKKA